MKTPRLRLNGRNAEPRELDGLFAALADPELLTARGGFLLRAHLGPDRLYLGVLPVLLDGVRNYHYQIPLGTDAWPILIGCFNPDLTVQLLCPPELARSECHDDPAVPRDEIAALCRIAMDHGYPPEREFDWITRSWFADCGIFPESVGCVGEATAPG